MSQASPAIYLSALAYQLGVQKLVAELAFAADVRQALLGPDGGLEYYRVSELSSLELAQASISLSLQRSDVAPERIDTVLFTSNSLSGPAVWTKIGKLMGELGLTHAAPLLLSAGDCCNFQTSTRTALSLIGSGQCSNILLVTVDRVADLCPGDYLAIRGAGINSDAAASCLVSNEVTRGLRMAGRPVYALDTRLTQGSEAPDAFMKVVELARKVFSSLYERNGLRPGDIDRLVTNTYKRDVVEVLAMAARLPMSKVFTANISRTGHCFAADNLINLCDSIEAGDLRQNSKVAVMASGISQWSAFVAEYVV